MKVDNPRVAHACVCLIKTKPSILRHYASKNLLTWRKTFVESVVRKLDWRLFTSNHFVKRNLKSLSCSLLFKFFLLPYLDFKHLKIKKLHTTQSALKTKVALKSRHYFRGCAILILGIYPEQFVSEASEKSSLDETYSTLKASIPSKIILHILPMWESEGDGGFAVSSWSEIHPGLGSVKDLQNITKSWRTIIDGIFNHVAWGHPIAQLFLQDPDNNADLLHAIKSNDEPYAPYAPRGGSVYLKSELNGANWYIWHTFGSQAVDINLSNKYVLQQIEAAINFYNDIGVWGLRLDALGYFGKIAQNVDHSRNPGGVEVHNSDGVKIAENLIRQSSESGMTCLLQIDSDQKVELYKNTFEHRPAVIDYAFTAQFVFSILFQDANRIAEHLNSIREGLDYAIVRPLRTHDGILFRSRNLSERDRSQFETYLDEKGFQKRVTNNKIYESNHSLPHLLGIQESQSLFFRKLSAGIIIAELTATYSYIYLNALVGDEPELEKTFSDDPRELQRRPIDPKLLEDCLQCQNNGLNNLLSTLETYFDSDRDNNQYKVWADNKLLIIESISLGLSAAINFSDQTIKFDAKEEVLFSDGYDSTNLNAFGSVLYRKTKEGK